MIKDINMVKSLQFLLIATILFFTKADIFSQIKSGPMVGYVEHRTAKIWLELQSDVDVQLKYWKTGVPSSMQTAFPNHNKRFNFHTIIFDCVNMDFGSMYEYEIFYGKKSSGVKGSFKTQDLWKFRKAAPDFNFITGSCAFFNEPLVDRPGKPYGGDSSIFYTMALEKSDFMLWLGDNWYTREVDFNSEWGLWNRASRDRGLAVVQNFMKSMPQYAIWDDHDYGPNNEGLSYIFKNETRNVFSSYWANPTYGTGEQGVYTKVSHYDLDLFLMDDRTWRSSDVMKDSIAGMPNPEKTMYGKTQMDWLKNSLLNSYATFKIIATGSPFLNRNNRFDCAVHYVMEHQDILNFIALYKIKGVIFLTGDIHRCEVIEEKREGLYSLYDLTISPLTSGVYKLVGPELNNPMRVEGSNLEEQNYGRISIFGKPKERKLKLEYLDKIGTVKFTWEISETQLK